MGIELVVCDGCQRHLKADAVARGVACPFCGQSPSSEASSAASAFTRPMLPRDRSVLLFGAAAVAGALAVTGCGKEGSDSGGSGVVMPYGVPIPQQPEAGPIMPPPTPDAGTAEPPKRDAGTTSTPVPIAPAYGAPPVLKKQ